MPKYALPASVPPRRPTPIASAEQRVAILSAACGAIALDAGPRNCNAVAFYTIDTLAELRMEQGGRPLNCYCGADAFAGLPSWHRWRELFDGARCADRPARRPSCLMNCCT